MRAENHREVDHVAAGQKGAQRKGLVELFRGEPSPPLHHVPSRPGQDPPKPDSEIAAKTVNSSAMLGRGGLAAAGVFGASLGGTRGSAGELIEVL